MQQVVVVQVEQGLWVVDVGQKLRQVGLELTRVVARDVNVRSLHVASVHRPSAFFLLFFVKFLNINVSLSVLFLALFFSLSY